MNRVKKITCEDTDEFIDMLRFRYRVYVCELGYISPKYEFDLLKMEYDKYDMSSTFFVVKEGDDIVGCSRLIEDKGAGLPVYEKVNIKDSKFNGHRNIELGRFIVDSSKQRSMLFPLLLGASFSSLFEMNCEYIFADTFKDGESNKILKRLGFKDSGMDYHDKSFNLSSISTLLYCNRNELKNEFDSNPNRSQKALLKYQLKQRQEESVCI
ncbi:MAG TPA: GNAT family N-acyltransferase [Clostridia bacterium]|nr:GNAT family N-acyltransferase [Clostridia bacterium]